MSELIELQPQDEHNLKLEANVHPPDWQNPKPTGRYNMVVIGGGTAGLVSAVGAAGLGAKVALIEKKLLGGDCLNVGCVPSKGVISAARIAAAVRDCSEFGVDVDGYRVDFAKAMQRMRRLRATIAPHDSAQRFSDLGVDIFYGSAEFCDSSSIRVGDRVLDFRRAVIATGGRALAPTIAGIDQVDYLTNESVFSLTELPKRFGIIGAGPIGCELAQSYARFGSEVFLVESTRGILPKEDRDAADIVRKHMEHDAVTFLPHSRDVQLRNEDEGTHVFVDNKGDDNYDVSVDKLLIAVGRAPNVENLNLETVGIEYDMYQGIKVNDYLQTTNRNIYAAGDVCSEFKFTHAADFMARIVIRNALFKGRAKVSALTIPWATYTSPEVAHVGMTAADAEKQGVEIDTYTQPFDDVDRAILEGEDDGFVRIHTRKGTDKIVGCTIVATNAGDMIGEVTLAMKYGIGLGKIAAAIHPYPTQAEAIRKVGDAYNRTRLKGWVKSAFNTWLSWTR